MGRRHARMAAVAEDRLASLTVALPAADSEAQDRTGYSVALRDDNRGKTAGRSHDRAIVGSGPASRATRRSGGLTADRYRRGLGQQAVSLGRRPRRAHSPPRRFGSLDRTRAAVASRIVPVF